ncbi:hypothetical protein PSACC_00793 [Paramicrosporidium saccamoebae]|uniref:Uncharacterized protein n=1 Tax=Paramicrosporidium saccamoebae TaxID=1246581 RepID=A0A2H9TNR1_9FUNG|nr:hypothetical protein PSACC_00793 [Paramicrosporidium saccamoebae]
MGRIKSNKTPIHLPLVPGSTMDIPRATVLPVVSSGRRIVYAVRLDDDLVARLKLAAQPTLQLSLDPSEPLANNVQRPRSL